MAVSLLRRRVAWKQDKQLRNEKRRKKKGSLTEGQNSKEVKSETRMWMSESRTRGIQIVASRTYFCFGYDAVKTRQMCICMVCTFTN